MPEPIDAYNGAFSALSGKKSDLKTNSRTKEFLTGRVLEKSISVTGEVEEKKSQESKEKEKQTEDQKVFQIASITKTFTAATIVRMASDEKYQNYFSKPDEEDPMATPISSTMSVANSSAVSAEYLAGIRVQT